jgi:hypothetical protein
MKAKDRENTMWRVAYASVTIDEMAIRTSKCAEN